jgi:hypothetical protein
VAWDLVKPPPAPNSRVCGFEFRVYRLGVGDWDTGFKLLGFHASSLLVGADEVVHPGGGLGPGKSTSCAGVRGAPNLGLRVETLTK